MLFTIELFLKLIANHFIHIGASSLRATIPSISPQGQPRPLQLLQPGLPAGAFEASMVSRFLVIMFKT